MDLRLNVRLCLTIMLVGALALTGAVMVLAQETTPEATPDDAVTPTPPPEPVSPELGQQYTVTGNTFRPEAQELTDDMLGQIQLPEGFEINVFARDLGNVRMMVFAPDGTLFVSRREEGDIIALFDENQDGVSDVEGVRIVASGLDYVHGLAIRDERLYIVTDTDLYAADLQEGGQLGTPELLVDDLPDAGQHPNRTLAFGEDGMLYITVGSTCNSCDETNDENATILRMDLASMERTILAEGLRNTIGFDWHPETGELWSMDMGIDWRGDDDPPEELNHIQPDGHYGWPWCYGDAQPDVYLPMDPPGTTKEDFCPTTISPVLTYQAHASPLNFVFYTGEQFPEEYRNDAFVTLRGSWNRYPAVGYRIVHLPFEDGEPTQFEDFMTGFLTEDGTGHYGRLAGLVIAPDGALLVSEDENGVIYRISYTGGE